MRDYIDIIIAKLAIWSIRRGYGANCETSDLDDFPVVGDTRCPSCRAKEIIDWLEEHISEIKGE